MAGVCGELPVSPYGPALVTEETVLETQSRIPATARETTQSAVGGNDPLAGLAPEELTESGTLERTGRHRAPALDTGSTSRLLRVLNGGNLAATATDEPDEMLLAPGALGFGNTREDKKR